jgi:hypothetical protein
VNSSRRLERFSGELTPLAPKPISAEIWVRSDGVRSTKRFPRIVEEAQREWLNIEIYLIIKSGNGIFEA